MTIISDSFVIESVKVVVGTKVGRSKHMRIMPGGALDNDQEFAGPSSIFVGKKLDEHRGAFLLEYPMDKSSVVDGQWDAMEHVYQVRVLIVGQRNVVATKKTFTSTPLTPLTHKWRTTRFC